ncbi:MAG: 40S ribosomal protein S25 [Candidatus Bathyarchaeota archaeon]|nr:40S ribosomal protein S25 [Candidatus Bathyarchaeota archaeon]
MSDQAPREKIIGSVDMPDINSKEVTGALNGMKAITATAVATRFNLKISVAKRMLTMMEEKGAIEMVTRSGNLKVYKMVGTKPDQ